MLKFNSESKAWCLKHGNKALDLSTLPRCQAIASTSGDRCKRAAKKGQKYCGIHSGRYKPGRVENLQPGLKHGFYTEKARQERAEASEAIRHLHGLIENITFNNKEFCNA